MTLLNYSNNLVKDVFQNNGYETEKMIVKVSDRPDLSHYQCNEAFNIAKKLSSVLFDNLDRLIFASATIVANGNFNYFKKSLGLDEEDCIEAIIKSPFNYYKKM